MGDLHLNFKDGISGDSKDITDFLKNNNIDLGVFLKDTGCKSFKIWYLLALIIIFIITLFLCFFGENSCNIYKISSLCAVILLVVIVFCIHLRFDRWPLTIIAIIGGLLLLLVSFRIKTPNEVIMESEQIISSQFVTK